jgi:hypothetical protein
MRVDEIAYMVDYFLMIGIPFAVVMTILRLLGYLGGKDKVKDEDLFDAVGEFDKFHEVSDDWLDAANNLVEDEISTRHNSGKILFLVIPFVVIVTVVVKAFM